MLGNLFCVFWYRPPRYNKDFIQQFLLHIVLCYDNVLIDGDFNIHVCCPNKPVSEFLQLVDSFNFTQIVNIIILRFLLWSV